MWSREIGLAPLTEFILAKMFNEVFRVAEDLALIL